MPRDDLELETEPTLVDLTDLQMSRVLRMTDDGALAHALRRVRRESAGSDVSVSSFQSAISHP